MYRLLPDNGSSVERRKILAEMMQGVFECDETFVLQGINNLLFVNKRMLLVYS
jgi:hypothetical protein